MIRVRTHTATQIRCLANPNPLRFDTADEFASYARTTFGDDEQYRGMPAVIGRGCVRYIYNWIYNREENQMVIRNTMCSITMPIDQKAIDRSINDLTRILTRRYWREDTRALVSRIRRIRRK